MDQKPTSFDQVCAQDSVTIDLVSLCVKRTRTDSLEAPGPGTREYKAQFRTTDDLRASTTDLINIQWIANCTMVGLSCPATSTFTNVGSFAPAAVGTWKTVSMTLDDIGTITHLYLETQGMIHILHQPIKIKYIHNENTHTTNQN